MPALADDPRCGRAGSTAGSRDAACSAPASRPGRRRARLGSPARRRPRPRRARPQAQRRRRRRRRGLRRADRGARARAQRATRSIVLEARDRVGGRAAQRRDRRRRDHRARRHLHRPDPGPHLGPGREDEGGPFETYNTGENLYIADGKRLRFSDTAPTGSAPPDPAILPDLALIVTAARREVDHGAGRRAVGRGERRGVGRADAASSTSSRTRPSPEFKALVPIATRPIFGAEPRELSLLFVLFYIASSGNEENPGTFERNFNTRNGAQMFRFAGGSQLICDADGAQARRSLVLESPVRRIVQGRGVTVHSDRVEVEAKRVIVAVPPILTGKIDYEPGLPDERVELIDHYPQGTMTKAACVYDRPFWRDDGLTGQVLFDKGPLAATFDDSPEDGSKGVVFGFVAGDQAREFAKLSKRARREAMHRQLRRASSAPGRPSPSSTSRPMWKRETWTRGCPVGIPGLGADRGPRRGAGEARRPHPLGRHRDLELLGGLHGRRRALGRARRGRGRWTDCEAACGRSSSRGALIALAAWLRPRAARSGRASTPRSSRWSRRPGFPARAYVAPNRRVYEGTYTNPERRHGALAGARVRPQRRPAALVDDRRPGPGGRPRRPGGDQRLARAAGPARQGAGAGADPEPAQRAAAHLGDLSRPTRSPTTPPGAGAASSTSPTTPTRRSGGFRRAAAGPTVVAAGPAARRARVRDDRDRADRDRRHLLISQQSSAGGGGGNPATGKIYEIEIGADGEPGRDPHRLGEPAVRRARTASRSTPPGGSTSPCCSPTRSR